MKHSSLSRRTFLQSMAAAGAAAPFVWIDRSTVAEDLNSQLTFAAIGVGGPGSFARGGKIARDAAKHARPVAVCEVDRNHANMFNDEFDNKLTVYKDYRKLLEKENIDFVTIGTPDHWHVPIAIAALRAGCDVYCEKPLTLTIDEGKLPNGHWASTNRARPGSRERGPSQTTSRKTWTRSPSLLVTSRCPTATTHRRISIST